MVTCFGPNSAAAAAAAALRWHSKAKEIMANGGHDYNFHQLAKKDGVRQPLVAIVADAPVAQSGRVARMVMDSAALLLVSTKI